MNRNDVISIVKKLDLPILEYYILSGASLVLRNIKDTCKDLDLCVSNRAFELLKEKFDVKKSQKPYENLYEIGDEIEFFVEPKENFKMEFEGGYPLEDIDTILRFKKNRNLEKDRRDILKIEEYLKNMKYEKTCGAIVIEDGKVLIVKQKEGTIGFPKGHVEQDETEEETAIREVKEETGVDIKIIPGYRYVTTYKSKINTVKELIIFLARKVSGQETPQEAEIANVEWVNLNEANEKLTYDNLRKLYKEAYEDIINL